MSKHNSNTVKLNAKHRTTFYGTTEDGRAVLRCGSCGETMSVDEAKSHICPAQTRVTMADGVGINFYRDLTAFQQQILFVLRRIERGMTGESTSCGLAIKRELESLHDVDINHGRLYPNLDELVEMGLVEKQMIDRRTNRYSTTEAGRQVVDQHVRWVLDSVSETIAIADGGDQS